NKIPFAARDLGEQRLRNIPRAVRAFKLVRARDGRSPRADRTNWFSWRSPRLWALSAAAASAVVVLVVTARSHLPVPTPFKLAASSSSAARAFDAKRVPLVTDRVRASLADFDRQPDFKAVAISHIGWGVASGAPDAVSAEREAIDRCKKRDQKGEC